MSSSGLPAGCLRLNLLTPPGILPVEEFAGNSWFTIPTFWEESASASGELAARDQPGTHRMEVARAHPIEECHFPAGRGCTAIGADVIVPAASTNRGEANLGCRQNTDARGQLLQEFAIQCCPAFLGNAGVVDSNSEYAFGFETSVGSEQVVKTPDEEQRTHQQNESRCHLNYHQRAPQSKAFAAGGDATAPCADSCHRGEVGGTKRRRQAEENTGGNSQPGGEAEKTPVHTHADEYGAIGGADRGDQPRSEAVLSLRRGEFRSPREEGFPREAA